ncbi:MAG: hypothetical protein HGA47_11145, partial [Zoogloea sp.]|nr:hypothetical protein [Zoogloea sp.]
MIQARHLLSVSFLFALLASWQPAGAQFSGRGMGGMHSGNQDRRASTHDTSDEPAQHPEDDALGQLNRVHEALLVTPAQEPL